MIKTFSIIAIVLLGFSCSNSETPEKQEFTSQKTTNKGANIVEPNDEIENEEASELNTKAIEYVGKGNYKTAQNLLLKAIQLEPNNAVILNNLGLTEMEIGEFDKTVDYFNRAYTVSEKKYIQAMSNLALLYYRSGKHELAIEQSIFVLGQNPSTSVSLSTNFTLAITFADSGKCKKAQEYYIKLKGFENIKSFNVQMINLEQKIENCFLK